MYLMVVNNVFIKKKGDYIKISKKKFGNTESIIIFV